MASGGIYKITIEKIADASSEELEILSEFSDIMDEGYVERQLYNDIFDDTGNAEDMLARDIKLEKLDKGLRDSLKKMIDDDELFFVIMP